MAQVDESAGTSAPPRVTPRESQVLRWIAVGKTDWEIGQILDISAKTVNYHVEKAKRKFGVATRIQAVMAALRLGMLSQ
jgi:DNA-binding CsgD family transcriptional regulator